MTLRLGLISTANINGKLLGGARAAEGVEVVAVGSRDAARAEAYAAEHGLARAHGSYEALLADPEVEAVYIPLPNSMHVPWSVRALEAGKHVLCEARMAMNAEEGRRMLAASRRAPHLVAQLVPAPHTLEVDPTLTALVSDGSIGEVLAVEIQANQQPRFPDPAEPLHWRQDVRLSGNNVMNMGIWYEAMMRWLGPARRVMALGKIAVPQRRDETGALRDVKIPDHLEILATLRDGAVARLRFSSVAALGPASEVWIFGSDGTLRLDAEGKRLFGGRRGDKELSEIAIPAARRVGWRVEEEFVNAIRGREKVARTTFEDGVRYMEFTDAVASSLALGRAVDVVSL